MGIHQQIITPELRTTSRVVAEKFGKNHRDVLRRIQKTSEEVGDEFNERNFALVKYIDAKGEARPMYEMTRDGFSLLAMGFTGKAAMGWKVRFIEAFNAMEAHIKSESENGVRTKDAPIEFEDEMPETAWLSLVRETRLAHGVAAAQRVYAQSPFGQLLVKGENEPEIPSGPLSPEQAEQLGFVMTFCDAAILRALNRCERSNPKTVSQLVHLAGYSPEETREAVDRLSAFDLIRRNPWQKRAWNISAFGSNVLSCLSQKDF